MSKKNHHILLEVQEKNKRGEVLETASAISTQRYQREKKENERALQDERWMHRRRNQIK
jgi:hypothetical protein